MQIAHTEIKVFLGDITESRADAIVNAANNKLVMGGGVAGVIKKKGGRIIEEEAVKKGPIEIGQAIQTNARFHIDALGFLGDQYIEVTPAASSQVEVFLTNGATVVGDAPFNMQEAVRSISGLVDQGQKTMADLDKAVNNVNNTILDAATLTNFVTT